MDYEQGGLKGRRVARASLVLALVASWFGLATPALAAEVIPIEQSAYSTSEPWFTPLALGDGGHVAGMASFPGRSGQYPARWVDGVLSELAPFPGDLAPGAYDVDDEGVVVGRSTCCSSIPEGGTSFTRALKWDPTSDTPVDISPGEHPQRGYSVANAITPGGTIFGNAVLENRNDVRDVPVRFNGDGTVTSLWDYPPMDPCIQDYTSYSVRIYGVSPDGTQALVSGHRACPTEPLLVRADDEISLADCLSDQDLGHQVGNGSTVVGQDDGSMPVLWKEGTCTRLAVPEDTISGSASAINSDGVIVGAIQDGRGFHGVTWAADGTFGFIEDLLSENSPWKIGPAIDVTTEGLILAGGIANGTGRYVIIDPGPTQVVPDLDQAVPSQVSTYSTGTGPGRQFRIGFEAAVDNVGAGPLLIDGHRSTTSEADMTADQQVLRADGSERTYPGVGAVRFNRSSWRLLRFDSYELHRVSDYRLIARRDGAFCLHDGYDSNPDRRLTSEPDQAQIAPGCGGDQPDLVTLRQGISVGYGVAQASEKEEFLDVTELPAGRYYLVHRVNKARKIVESDYGNNASSLLIRLRWSDGTRRTPTVSVLKECPNKDRCPD